MPRTPIRLPFLSLICLNIICLSLPLGGCAVNPATGAQQFTAFLPPSQEAQLGANQHTEILRTFGEIDDPVLRTYVEDLGQKIAVHTERGDINYRFTILDTPMVNAFAAPGGYVYISRGLMAQAMSESELAAVIAHEIGHVTGRHIAARYSQGVLTSLAASLLASATESRSLAQAAGIGSELYIKSYSRSQEHEADLLGVRYLHRAGYDPHAMTSFLANLEQMNLFEQRLAGGGAQKDPLFHYFATHPRTPDRIGRTSGEAARYPAPPASASEEEEDRNAYLRRLDGMIYGDTARQGFVRGRHFWHPDMGFTFSVPANFTLTNQPEAVIARAPSGSMIVLDQVRTRAHPTNDPLSYLTQEWVAGEPLQETERLTINGKPAATGAVSRTINGQPVTLRLMAIAGSPGTFFRFQIVIPRDTPPEQVEDLRRTTYSFRDMTPQEKRTIRPDRLRIVTARHGDSVASLSARMAFEDFKEDRFRALNALSPTQEIQAGRRYKIVVRDETQV